MALLPYLQMNTGFSRVDCDNIAMSADGGLSDLRDAMLEAIGEEKGR